MVRESPDAPLFLNNSHSFLFEIVYTWNTNWGVCLAFRNRMCLHDKAQHISADAVRISDDFDLTFWIWHIPAPPTLSRKSFLSCLCFVAFIVTIQLR
jgi:hypothetical protein